jgi:DNA ligase (NAD+)
MGPNTPMQRWFGNEDANLISKKKQNISHKYPELAGTLDKCKFVLRNDAKMYGIKDINKSNVLVFEDVLHSWIGVAEAVYPPIEYKTDLIAELKYDGVAVDLEVDGDTVISAWSRGDTARDKAADLTPIFGGMKFPNAGPVQKGTVFGLQTECIITYENMMILSTQFGKSYKNARNAIIGLLGSLDARKYLPYFTLVPIRTAGLNIPDREVEIEFLNSFYTMGVNMKYAVLKGDVYSLLFQVHSFVSMAYNLIPSMPFLYDGVVVSLMDNKLKQILGRKNSVNKWSMAIKFETNRKKTVFTHYTFSVGQNGVITPKAWFRPVSFLGTVHDNTTAHSYQRFKQLALRPGDIVVIEYRNEVICYITKDVDPYNLANPNPEIQFPTLCPSCGTPLIFTEKSARCPNIVCPERNINRISNMLKKLSLKGFSDRYMEILKITSFKEFVCYDRNKAVSILGEVMGDKFMQLIQEFNNTVYEDYMIIGAIGFSSIAQRNWETILREVRISTIIEEDDKELYNILIGVEGVGPKTAETIVYERKAFMQDLIFIYSLPNIKKTFNTIKTTQAQVRFSGIRDAELEKAFNDLGFDASGSKGVTNSTEVLVIPFEGFMSNKLKKVPPSCLVLTPAGAWRYINDIKMRKGVN